MLSRIAYTLVLSRSARRVVSKQYVLKQCRHCCQPHTHLHTTHLLFKEEIQSDFKSTVSEGDPLAEQTNDIQTPIVLSKPTSAHNDTSQNSPTVPVEEEKSLIIPAVVEKSPAVPALADGTIVKHLTVPRLILQWLEDEYIPRRKISFSNVAVESCNTSPNGRIQMSGKPEDVDFYIHKLKLFLNHTCLLSSTVTKDHLLQSLCQNIRKEIKSEKLLYIHSDQHEFYCIGLTKNVRKAVKHLEDLLSEEGIESPAEFKAVWAINYIPELRLTEKESAQRGPPNLMQFPFDHVEGTGNIDKKEKKKKKMIEKKTFQEDKSRSGYAMKTLLFDKEGNTSHKDMKQIQRKKGMQKQALQGDTSRPQIGDLRDNLKSLRSKLSQGERKFEDTTRKMPAQNTSQNYRTELVFVDKLFETMLFTDKRKKEIIKETGVIRLNFERKGLAIFGEPGKVRECKKQLQRLCDDTVIIPFSQGFHKAVFDRHGLLHRSLESQFDVTIRFMPKGDLMITGTQENRRCVLVELRDIIENRKNERKIDHNEFLEGLENKRHRHVYKFLSSDKFASYSKLHDGSPAFPYIQIYKSKREEQYPKQEPRQSPEVQINSLFGNSNTKSLQMDLKASESQPVSLQIPQLSTGLETKHQLKLKKDGKTDKKNKRPDTVPKALNLKPRPPVVTIMGHVDHGKTTLLDALRKSNVVAQEFGGITQHIGAFQVQLKSGQTITFLDTPGHAAFHNMRSRGASVTDIIVLVVAAEDGIMNQTLESIKHAKKAKVPVIVAINKIDHPNANPDKVKYELSNHGLMAEEFGGDVQIIPISALKRINLDELQDNIVVQSELLDLKADHKCDVKGSVIESKIDIRRGKQVTTLIQSGTLKKGDLLIAGSSSAKVRMMFDENGKLVKEATPGTPVVVTGWDSLPSAGEVVTEIKTEVELKKLLAEKERQSKEELIDSSETLIEDRRGKLLEETLKTKELRKSLHWKEYKKIMYTRKGDVAEEGLPKFPLIIKADVDGSLEVLLETLETFYSEHIELSIVSSGVGDITDGDLELANSTGARIYGFNVKENKSSSKSPDVQLTLDNVIYDLFDNVVDDIKEVMPTFEEETEIGKGEVLELFKVKDNVLGTLNIAGCKCAQGTFKKDSIFKIVRNEEVMYEGKVLSMKRLKKDVSSVKEGNDCGLGVELDIEIKPGDVVICIDKETKRLELEWDHGVKH